MKILAKTLVPFLKSSLNAYGVRHQAIAENIANLDTPSYKPFKVVFEENLQRLMEGRHLAGRATSERHLPVGRAQVLRLEQADELAQASGDVKLEAEMAELAKNQLRYEFVARRLAGSYEALRTAIIGRIR